MTLKPHYPEPCWELVRTDTKHPPQWETGDGWPHYKTEADALAGLDDDDSELIAQRPFSTACVGLFCDGPDCGAADDPADLSDEGWTHLDPSDPLPFPVEDIDWLDVGGKHYCPDCIPPWCDDCDERHYGAHVEPQPRPIRVTEGQGVLL